MTRVFVSYSHRQTDWVFDELCVILGAAGADVLVDAAQFEAGRPVLGQMDAVQASADVHVLVLSPDYVASDYCMHELRKAVAFDPTLEQGKVIPVWRIEQMRPPELAVNPLCVDLRETGTHAADAQWQLLLRACGADVRCKVSAWQNARRAIVERLQAGTSINLVVRAKARWRPLIERVRADLEAARPCRRLGIVDLNAGTTASRRGFLQEILQATGTNGVLPHETNEDLVEFTRALRRRGDAALVALQHFDNAGRLERHYGVDLFAALRDLVSNDRKLCLLIQSRVPFVELLPPGHALSSLTQVQYVELP